MTDEIFFEGVRFVSANEASSLAGLTRDYVARLCREGKVNGRRVGKNWYAEEASLKRFLLQREYSAVERGQELARERLREYHGDESGEPKASAPEAVTPSKGESDIRRVLSLALARRNSTALATVSSPRLPEGIADAALRNLHVPVHAVTPLVEFGHKLLALALSLALTFGVYSTLNPRYARFAFDSVRDGIASLSHAGEAARAGTNELVAAAADPFALYGSFVNNVSTSAASLARAVNQGVNELVYATALPNLFGGQGTSPLGGSAGEVAVEVVPYQGENKNAPELTQAQTVNQTIVNRPIVEREVRTERVVVQSGVTGQEVDQKLQQLNDKLSAQMLLFAAPRTGGQTVFIGQSAPLTNINSQTLAVGNQNIVGGSITDSRINAATLNVVGTSTLSNTNVFGTLSIATTSDSALTTGAFTAINATTTNFLATNATTTNFFALNASTTNATSTNLFSVFGTFTTGIVDTLTSTLATITNLTTTNATTTNATTTNLVATNLTSLTSPRAPAFIATSSAATSTFAGGFSVGTSTLVVDPSAASVLVGTSTLLQNALFAVATSSSLLFVDSVNGFVGVGTSSPFSNFSVVGNGYFSGGLGVGTSTTTPGDLAVAGNAKIGGNLTVVGNNTVLGNSSANTLTINSSVNSSFIPNQNITYDLGSPSLFWRNAYVGTLTANNISAASTTIGGTQSSTFTINSDNVSADQESQSLIFFRGTVVPNAILAWNAATSSKRFEFNQPLYIQNQSGSTTQPTLTLQGVAGQSGDILRIASSSGTALFSIASDGSTSIGGALTVNGNLTSTLQASTTAFSSLGPAYFGTTATTTIDSAGNLSVAGNLTVSGAQNYSGLAQFANASSTLFSVFNKAYFGATATSTFDSAGNLLLAGTLTATSGLSTLANLFLTGSTTLQNFTFGNATGTNATTTNLFATTASSTNLFATTGAVGTFTAGNATSTTLFSTTASSTNLYAQVASVGTFTASGAATLGNATTTSLFSTTASSTNLFSTTASLGTLTSGSLALSNALLVSSGGTGATSFGQGWIFSAGGTGALAASSSPTVAYLTATSTSATSLFAGNLSVGGTLGATGGLSTLSNLLLTGSTTLQNFTFGNATGTNATTTSFFATTASSTNLFSTSASFGSLSLAGTLTGPDGGTWQSTLNPPGGVGGINLPATSDFIVGTPSSGNTWTRISFEGYQINTSVNDNTIFGGLEWKNASSTSVGTITSGGSPTAGIMQFSLLGNASVFNFTTGSTGALSFSTTTSFQIASVANATDYLIAKPSNGGAPSLSTNAGNLALLPAGGAVGIGTTSPYALLSISNSASTAANTPLLTIASTTGGTATSTLLTVLANGNIGVSSTTPFARISVTGTGTGTGYTFIAADSSNAPKFVVQDNGNAGVNLSVNGGLSPQSAFEVGGALTIDRNAFTNWISSVNDPRIYSVAIAGSVFGSGDLVIQPRTTAASNIILATGSGTPAPRLVVAGGGFGATVGAIGIGTSSPVAALDVASNPGATTPLFRLSSVSAGYATTTSFLVDSSGNVGIGTASPAWALDILRNTTSQSRVNLVNSNSGSAAYTAFVVGNDTFSTLGGFFGNSSGNTTFGGANSVNLINTQAASLGLGTNNSVNLVINSSGNVGIGTTSPDGKFTVDTTGSGNHPSFDISNPSGITVQQSNYITVSDGTRKVLSGIQGLVGSSNISNYQGSLAFLTTPAAGSPTERVRIDSSGNVGIGTTTFAASGQNLKIVKGGTSGEPRTILDWQGDTSDSYSAYEFRSNNVFEGGMYLNHSSGLLGLFTSGDTANPRLAITSTGNVGVGTTTPWAVAGNTTLAVNGDVSANFLFCGVTGNDCYITSQTSGKDMIFRYNGTGEAMRIKGTTGNIGIGTTTPAAPLVVAKDQDAATLIRVANYNTGTTNQAGVIFDTASGNSAGLLSAIGTGGTSYGGASSLNLINVLSGPLALGTANSVRMTINSSGNVGIGTTTPPDKFVVANGYSKSAVDGNEIAQFAHTGSGYITVADDSLRMAALGTADENSLPWVGSLSSTKFEIRTAAVARMTIDTSGNVGIGTTNPGYNLTIQQSADSQSSSGIAVYRASAASHTVFFQGGDSNAYLWNFGSGFRIVPNNGVATGLTMDSSGEIGINQTSPTGMLDVRSNGSAEATLIARFTDTTPTSMVDIYDGNDGTTANAANAVLKVKKANTTGRSINAAGTINASGADYAEYFYQETSGSLQKGQIVCLAADGKAEACASGARPVGVVSTSPGFVGNDLYDPNNPGATALIGLTGQVPVIVSADGGAIAPGDPIAVSTTTPGVGVKASTGDASVGIAMSAFSGVGTSTVTAYLHLGETLSQLTLGAMVVDSNGNVGVGTTTPAYTLTVAGSVGAEDFVNYSSRGLKTDINGVSSDAEDTILGQIASTTVFTYRYKDESASSPLHIGLITDSAPSQVLSAGGNGVDIYKLAAFTFAGLKAEDRKVAALDVRVTNLETAMTQLQSSGGGGAGLSLSSLLTSLSQMGATIAQGVAHFAYVVADALSIGSPSNPTGITMYDKATGDPYCFQVENGAPTTTPGACSTVPSIDAAPAPATSSSTTTPTTTSTTTASSTSTASTATPSTSSGQATTTTTSATSTSSTSGPIDNVAPTVTLNGGTTIELGIGDVFVDPGATAIDDRDGDMTAKIVVAGSVDTSVAGTYTLTYSATDAAGNTGSASRTVVVSDPNAATTANSTTTASSTSTASTTTPSTSSGQATTTTATSTTP